MPRGRRALPDNTVHHVVNRGNKRETVFREPTDYKDFICLLAEAKKHAPMRVLSATVMRNHFHLVLWPEFGVQLPAYMMWLMNAQIRRLQKRHRTVGLGHVYQDRYKNFLVEGDAHLYRVLRYVEANPLRASIVKRAEDYEWSSLSQRLTPDGREYLSEWPVPRPSNWMTYVNEGIGTDELAELRLSVQRSRPYGSPIWVDRMIEEHDLEWTRNPQGRPRKRAKLG